MNMAKRKVSKIKSKRKESKSKTAKPRSDDSGLRHTLVMTVEAEWPKSMTIGDLADEMKRLGLEMIDVRSKESYERLCARLEQAPRG